MVMGGCEEADKAEGGSMAEGLIFCLPCRRSF